MSAEPERGPRQLFGWRLAAMGLLAVLTLMPVTLPVTVLRGLVHDRFAVGELLTSLFMSINMIGALVAAPVAGALADRFGRRRALVVGALLTDAALLWAMSCDVPFPLFMGLRFFEGAAHIVAISTLLSIAADGAGDQRGRVLGVVGAGLTLGVASGAAAGGRIGNEDPLLTLEIGSAILIVAAGIAIVTVPRPRRGPQPPGWITILRLVLVHPPLRVPLVFAFVDRFTVGFFTTTFPLAMKRIHNLQPKEIGILLALFLGPFALLSYPFGRLSERRSPLWMMGLGSLLYGVAVASYPVWPKEHLAIWMVSLGLLSAVMFVPSMVLTVQRTPEGGRTTAMGAFNAAGSLGFIVGPLVGGALSAGFAESLGWDGAYAMAFVVAGLAEVGCVVLLVLSHRRTGSG